MTDTDTDDQPYHRIIRAAVLDGTIDCNATDDADRIIEYLLTSGYSIVPTPDGACTTTESCGRFACDTHGEQLTDAFRAAAPALLRARPQCAGGYHACGCQPVTSVNLRLSQDIPWATDPPPTVFAAPCRHCHPTPCTGHTMPGITG